MFATIKPKRRRKAPELETGPAEPETVDEAPSPSTLDAVPSPLVLRNSPRWNFLVELYLGTDLIERRALPRPDLDVPEQATPPVIERKGVTYRRTGLVGNAVVYRS